MTETIDIIDRPKLLDYLGLEPDADLPGVDTYVALTNGIVSGAWANPELPVPTEVFAIALEVAARPTRNPKGLASWTRSLDDGSRTERLPEKAARAGVFLTAEERRVLEKPASGRRRRRYGTVRARNGY